MPFNPFFPHVERDLIKTLKFGRKNDTSTEDDFIGYDSKVVSRRHSEIWAVGQDVIFFLFSPLFFIYQTIKNNHLFIFFLKKYIRFIFVIQNLKVELF